MILKRFIFECRYKPSFSWLDRRGALLDFLRNTNKFDNLANGPQNIGGARENKEWFHSIQLETDKLAGSIEAPALEESDISTFIKLAMDFREKASLDATNFMRIGARFIFVKEDTFQKANDFALSFMSPQFKQIFETENFTDCAMSPVAQYITPNGQKSSLRFLCGPVKPEEYGKFFNKPAIVGNSEGFLCDADFYSVEFTSIRIDKFIKTAYQKSKNIADELSRKLDAYEPDIK